MIWVRPRSRFRVQDVGRRLTYTISCSITSLDADMTVQSSAYGFVKIDVEGGELNVLKEQRELSPGIGHFLLEVYERWTAAFGYPPTDLLTFMRSRGYSEGESNHEGKGAFIRRDDPVPPAWVRHVLDVLFFTSGHSR